MSDSAQPAGLYLEVRAPRGTHREVELGPEIRIGRSTDNELQLPDESLSRHHARIRVDGRRVLFEDMGSRNGSEVNGSRVTGPLALEPGDRIRLGACEIILHRKANVHTDGQSVSEATAVVDATGIIPGRRELFDDLREENRALSLLSRAGTLLIAHASVRETLDALLELSISAFEAERVAIALIPEGGGPPEVAASRCFRGPTGEFHVSRTLADSVLSDRKAVCIVDVAADPSLASSESIQVSGVKSLMCAPLWDGKTVRGLFLVDRSIGRPHYDEDDLKVLSMLANVVAVKLENARLLEQAMERRRLEQEMAVAGRIQRSLLPGDREPPPEVDLHGICRACAEIGGDFYDHFCVGPDRLGLVIADVCGKGIGGALLAATAQAALSGASRSEVSVAERMSWLNTFVFEHSPPDQYITAVYAELDLGTGELDVATAGHPRPLVLRADGQVESLEEAGVPLGLIGGADYGSQRTKLERGDRLLLHTDGVTEASAGDRENPFDTERMITAAQESEGDAQSSNEAVFAALERFIGDVELRDDATVVTLRWCGDDAD